MRVKLGRIFQIDEKSVGKVTEIFALGFHYHTLDLQGNCIKSQQYALKTDPRFKYLWQAEKES